MFKKNSEEQQICAFGHAGELSRKVHFIGLFRKLLDIYIIVSYYNILRVFFNFFKLNSLSCPQQAEIHRPVPFDNKKAPLFSFRLPQTTLPDCMLP